jgi:hypothetical protein
MRATILLACSSMMLLLAGCGNVVTLTQAPMDCTNTTPMINVQYGAGQLVMSNECVKLGAAGGPVTLTFMAASAQTPIAEEVRTKFRGLGNWWLDEKTTGAAGTINVMVPGDAGVRGKAKIYKFEVRVSDVGVLDPRIVIQ